MNQIFHLHETWAVKDAEHHHVENPYYLPFVGDTDYGNLALKVIYAVVALVVATADEKFRLSVMDVVTGWKKWASGADEVEVAVEKDEEDDQVNLATERTGEEMQG